MKLHIFGASASGVTTLGQALSKRLGVPYVDSDDYFWLASDPPFTRKRDDPERNALIAETLKHTSDWILGGSVINWGNDTFPPFDLIGFLYLPPEIRIDRLRQRELDRYGSAIYTDPQRRQHFNDFVSWAADYDVNSGVANRTLQAHETWLSTTKIPVLRLTGDLTVEERMSLICQRLASLSNQS